MLYHPLILKKSLSNWRRKITTDVSLSLFYEKDLEYLASAVMVWTECLKDIKTGIIPASVYRPEEVIV